MSNSYQTRARKTGITYYVVICRTVIDHELITQNSYLCALLYKELVRSLNISQVF